MRLILLVSVLIAVMLIALNYTSIRNRIIFEWRYSEEYYRQEAITKSLGRGESPKRLDREYLIHQMKGKTYDM